MWISSTKEVIILALSVAASRGTTSDNSASPAAKWPRPVKLKKRTASRAGAIPAVLLKHTKSDNPPYHARGAE